MTDSKGVMRRILRIIPEISPNIDRITDEKEPYRGGEKPEPKDTQLEMSPDERHDRAVQIIKCIKEGRKKATREQRTIARTLKLLRKGDYR